MKGASLSRQSSCKDEVVILAVAPERFVALGLAPGVVVDDAVDDLPVAVVAVGHLPAGQVFAVEERDEAVGHGRRRAPSAAEAATTARTEIARANRFNMMLVPIHATARSDG